jgi:outer membrane protein assembly factor BamB
MLLLPGFSHGDWAQFLGPERSGVAADKAVPHTWPAEGPRKLWSRPVGNGFSGPVVQGTRAFLFHRLQDEETVECFEASKGTTLWKSGTPTAYVDDFGFDPGPRSTPALAGDRILTLGAAGQAECRDSQTGKLIWSVDTQKQFGARKGFFGLAPSPLIDRQQVILHVGGENGASILALDLATGNLRWKSGDDEASYASPLLVSFQGKRRLLVLTREALTSLDPDTGKPFFRFPWRPSSHASVSAATPLWVDGRIALSASYETGAAFLKYEDAGPKKIWESDEAISSHYSSLVHHQGFLYGFDGRQEQGCDLRCVEVETGKVRWTQKRTGAGHLILVGSDLLMLTEKGELVLTPATPDGFKPWARAQVLPFLARAHPALSDGRFYARSKDTLFCFELRAPEPTPLR